MDGRFREIQMFKDDMCGGKRGVPTQINFALRGKPTQLEAILIGDKKRFPTGYAAATFLIIFHQATSHRAGILLRHYRQTS